MHTPGSNLNLKDFFNLQENNIDNLKSTPMVIFTVYLRMHMIDTSRNEVFRSKNSYEKRLQKASFIANDKRTSFTAKDKRNSLIFVTLKSISKN